jgi:hypothetical protein
MSSNHPFLGFPTALYFSAAFLNIFTVLSSGIFSTCPNHLNYKL